MHPVPVKSHEQQQVQLPKMVGFGLIAQSLSVRFLAVSYLPRLTALSRSLPVAIGSERPEAAIDCCLCDSSMGYPGSGRRPRFTPAVPGLPLDT